MKKILLFYILPLVVIFSGTYLFIQIVYEYKENTEKRIAAKAEKAEKESRDRAVDDLLENRRKEAEKNDNTDVFGDDGVIKILFIGLDSRAGESSGHCDAIQFVKIDKKNKSISITAVPRGTYSPLPPGVAKLPSDYYVSNACGLVSLEYGVKQIEKILGEKEDYLVVVGFSEVLGILRDLKLPTMDTLRWLRQRQVYAIGEPQRAHNHSTFLKQLIVKFSPQQNSLLNKVLQRIIYGLVKTDLSLDQAQSVLKVMSEMALDKNPEKIVLGMRPGYAVLDIPYSSENLNDNLDEMISPIKDQLNKNDFSGVDKESAEAALLEVIGKKINDQEFVSWGFENCIWLQIDDDSKRFSIQYDFLTRYISKVATYSDKNNIVADYILEMEYYDKKDLAQKGRELLLSLVAK